MDDIIAISFFTEHLNRKVPCTVLVRFLFVSEHNRQTSQWQEWHFVLEITVLLVLFASFLPATTKRVLGS